jgi:multidrug resistance efflux pump
MGAVFLTDETQHAASNGTLTSREYQARIAELEAELAAAYATNRQLQDQIKKTTKAASNAERASSEALRAHSKMVETLTETMRENTALTIERDMWRSRAQRLNIPVEPPVVNVGAMLGMLQMTDEEVNAIRKAIARLHHPDSGGNAERMKLWNASLDRVERRSSS